MKPKKNSGSTRTISGNHVFTLIICKDHMDLDRPPKSPN